MKGVKFLTIASAIIFAFVVLTAGASPALASVTYYDHANAGGNAVVDIVGHQPPMRIRVLHYTWGSNVVGAGDALEVYLWAAPLRSWIAVACMFDNPSRAEWNSELFPGNSASNTLLVKNSELQVHKIGKTDVFAYWTEQLTALITGSLVIPALGLNIPWAVVFGVSSLTLPPGSLLIQGEGDELTGTTGPLAVPSGYIITANWNYYIAQATLECPTWNYHGPIGAVSTPSTVIKHITFSAAK